MLGTEWTMQQLEETRLAFLNGPTPGAIQRGRVEVFLEGVWFNFVIHLVLHSNVHVHNYIIRLLPPSSVAFLTRLSLLKTRLCFWIACAQLFIVFLQYAYILIDRGWSRTWIMDRGALAQEKMRTAGVDEWLSQTLYMELHLGKHKPEGFWMWGSTWQVEESKHYASPVFNVTII